MYIRPLNQSGDDRSVFTVNLYIEFMLNTIFTMESKSVCFLRADAAPAAVAVASSTKPKKILFSIHRFYIIYFLLLMNFC